MRFVLGPDLVVEVLVHPGRVGRRHIRCPAIELEHVFHLAERLAHLAVLPGIDRGLVNLGFLAPNPHVLLLFGLDVFEKPRCARVLRAEQQRVLQRLARMAVRMVVHVLAG